MRGQFVETPHPLLKLTKILFLTSISCDCSLLMCSSDSFIKLNQEESMRMCGRLCQPIGGKL